MQTFFMFGTYTADALDDISTNRTNEAIALIGKYEGKVNAMYTLLGDEDLILIVDFPGIAQAMQASVALARMTGIAFSTYPAVTVEEFDRLMEAV